MVANFYGEIYHEVYDASCGVKTDRYSIMNRIEAFGYLHDDDTEDPVFYKGDEELVFEDYTKAEQWVEEQERKGGRSC